MIRYGLWPEIIIFNENLSDFRDFCATFLGGQEDGLVHVQMQKKRYFLLFFAHLIVTLSLRLLVRLHLGNAKEKRVFLLYSARFALTLYPKYEKDEETLY